MDLVLLREMGSRRKILGSRENDMVSTGLASVPRAMVLRAGCRGVRVEAERPGRRPSQESTSETMVAQVKAKEVVMLVFSEGRAYRPS